MQDVVPSEGIHWKGIFLADMRPPEVRGSLSGAEVQAAGPRITLGTEAFVQPRPEQGRIQVRFPQTTTYERSSKSGTVPRTAVPSGRSGPASSPPKVRSRREAV